MSEHHVFHAMGIPIHITTVGLSTEDSNKAVKKAEDVFREYDLRFSRFKPESELMALNMSNATWHKVGVEMFEVIKRCVAIAAETDGAFDPSVGSVLASYGYGLPENFTLPSTTPTYRDLAFNDRELLIRLAPGQILEPACIVKGMAIDAAGKALDGAGVPAYMINVGGDIITKGNFENGESWNIAVQAPENPDAVVAIIGLKNAGMATSGVYQTKGERNGKKWHHLVNMKNKKPSNGIVSATIVADTCERADTEASLAILLNPIEATARLERSGLPYFLIDEEGLVHKNAAFAALEVPMQSVVE
ncbi:MAG: FAD:protein FMN transferase [Candidatus Paceibacterota bacterium]|jgi:thiamine biosynthesis lipoprotein